MKNIILKTAAIMFLFVIPQFLCAQDTTTPEAYPFNDPGLSTEERINDLINRLTLEEKAWQMMHNSPAVERLGIPEYNWWNEALHGIGRSGVATVFPQAIGMGAKL